MPRDNDKSRREEERLYQAVADAERRKRDAEEERRREEELHPELKEQREKEEWRRRKTEEFRQRDENERLEREDEQRRRDVEKRQRKREEEQRERDEANREQERREQEKELADDSRVYQAVADDAQATREREERVEQRKAILRARLPLINAVEKLLRDAGVKVEEGQRYAEIKQELKGRGDKYINMLDEAMDLREKLWDPSETQNEIEHRCTMVASAAGAYVKTREAPRATAEGRASFDRAMDLLAIAYDNGGSSARREAMKTAASINLVRGITDTIDLANYGAHHIMGGAPERPEKTERERLAHDLSRVLIGAGVDPSEKLTTQELQTRLKGRSTDYCYMMQMTRDLYETLNSKSTTDQEIRTACDTLINGCADYIKNKGTVRATEKGRASFDRALDLMSLAYGMAGRAGKEVVDRNINKANAARGLSDPAKSNDPKFIRLENYGVSRMNGHPMAADLEKELVKKLKACKPHQNERSSIAMEIMILRATKKPNQRVDTVQLAQERDRLMGNRELMDVMLNPMVIQDRTAQQEIVSGFLTYGKVPTVMPVAEYEAAQKNNKAPTKTETKPDAAPTKIM